MIAKVLLVAGIFIACAVLFLWTVYVIGYAFGVGFTKALTERIEYIEGDDSYV